ncbi:MAG TPA: hypothetical protein VFQ22_13895, partial [Longimicrobiales bacterium]|nr:hypothetical protein [Longimicrobiales bacterium]
PLSRAAIPHVVEAARALGVDVALVATDALGAYAESDPSAPPVAFADRALAAGALAHAPALVVYRGGAALGPAILGYKSADAYAALVAGRLAERDAPAAGAASAGAVQAPALGRSSAGEARAAADFRAVGIPGAYFRWVPGRDAIAYESRRRIWLLDLASGESLLAPGYIDFVPTPDGRYFVTPGPDDEGLEFYDAEQVFEASRSRRLAAVEPIFTDARMRDQYPSVGILERDATHTVYRVLTSWFDGLAYRDYDVRVDPATGVSSVRPVGERVEPCEGAPLSTPILAQDGRRVAVRDERSGTTKVMRLEEGGRCTELLDLGIPTSKVAWHPSGDRVAFASPRRSRTEAEHGIYVYDLRARSAVRVPGAEQASRLAFPEFVGDDALVFLIPAATSRDDSVFRVVSGF